MHNCVTSHLWLKSALHASSHPCMCTCVLRLGCFLLISPVFYFVPSFSFQPFLMFTSEFNERSRSNPLCDFRLGTVATSDHETLLTEEGAGLLLPRIVAEKSPEVERRRFYVLFVDIEAHGHMGSCPGYALLTLHGKASKSRQDEFRERVGMISERTLTGEARMDTCKDRIAETQRVRERKRARIERGAGDVPEEPRNRDDEQVPVRHADASGGYITENQHEEEIMRDIQVSKKRIRGSK